MQIMGHYDLNDDIFNVEYVKIIVWADTQL